MRKKYILVCFCFLAFFSQVATAQSAYDKFRDEVSLKASKMEQKYNNLKPTSWGEKPAGVVVSLRDLGDFQNIKDNSSAKFAALTFDLCGGARGSGFSEDLYNFLVDNKIRATFFVNVRWVEKNPELFAKIKSNPLIEVENHGLLHRPLSVYPREVYKINSTGSVKEVVEEVELAALIIEEETGRKPLFFRSGTAYYDDVSIKILNDLGYRAVAFSLNADRGATLSADEVYKNLMALQSGDIVIAHINQPKSATVQGFIRALPELAKKGFRFVNLD